ncbi:MAG: TolC family protein [Marinomonas sp.]|nr:MAG: TolC family protein [Marinomonas sp.]
MIPSRVLSITVYSALTIMIAGCSSTADNQARYYQTAETSLQQENQRIFGESTAQQSDAIDLADLIPDENLKTLINSALAGNPSLQQTLLSLKASELGLVSTHADRLPSASASLSTSRSEGSDTEFSLSSSVSWQLDIWSQLADAEQAATKSYQSDVALFRAAQASLVASVMKSWLELVSSYRAIVIEEKRLALLETNEALIIQRFRNGLGTLESLDEAQTSTSKSRSDLAEYKETLASNKRALQLLLGEQQSAIESYPTEYPDVWLDLSALPQQDLALRPDLQAAYLAIEAADYNASVAYKEMLPSLNLSASLSDSSTSLRDALFVSPVWSLLGQLSAPLFQAGTLKANHEIAKLEVAQSYQSYRETLLNAVNEVQDAIGQEKVLNTQQQHIQKALTSARSNRQQYEQKYRSGLVELSDLISAQQAVFDLEAELDTLQYQQLSNRVDLGLALGLGSSNT